MLYIRPEIVTIYIEYVPFEELKVDCACNLNSSKLFPCNLHALSERWPYENEDFQCAPDEILGILLLIGSCQYISGWISPN